MAEAEARTTAFGWLGKCVFMSQGGEENDDTRRKFETIRRNQNPADGATWEVPTDISEDYLKMMESEHRIKKGNSWIWEQIGNRPNHYLDCEAMNCAGALMLKIIGNDTTQATTTSG